MKIILMFALFMSVLTSVFSSGKVDIEPQELSLDYISNTFEKAQDNTFIGIYDRKTEIHYDEKGFILLNSRTLEQVKRINFDFLKVKYTPHLIGKYEPFMPTLFGKIIGDDIVFTLWDSENPTTYVLSNFMGSLEDIQIIKLIDNFILTEFFNYPKKLLFQASGKNEVGFWGRVGTTDHFRGIVGIGIVQLDAQGTLVNSIMDNLPWGFEQGTKPWERLLYQKKTGDRFLTALDPRNGMVETINLPESLIVMDRPWWDIFSMAPKDFKVVDGFYLKDGRLVVAKVSRLTPLWQFVSGAQWYLIDGENSIKISGFSEDFSPRFNFIHQE